MADSVGRLARKAATEDMRFEAIEQAQAYLDRWEERWADTRIHGTTRKQVGTVFEQVEREVGDFVIRRADGIHAYQLAVVGDDAFQEISHIVRGEDLLFSTARQIRLQQALGYVTPGYAHHPLVRDGSGHKLGKSTSAWPVDAARPLATLKSVLEFLHQPPVDADTIDSFWKQAIANWTIEAMQHA